VQVLEVHPGGIEEENVMTLRMMDHYGWWNVRGGSWCQVDIQCCPQHFWNGSVLNYLHLYDEINLCQEIPTEISGMHVLDAAGTLIPWAIVLQELMLMAKA
jgi:hypothetical protein